MTSAIARLSGQKYVHMYASARKAQFAMGAGPSTSTRLRCYVARRARIPADGYSLSGTDRERVMEVPILRTRRSWYLMKQRAQTHGGGWQRMRDDGVGDVIRRREAWLERHAATLAAALTAPYPLSERRQAAVRSSCGLGRAHPVPPRRCVIQKPGPAGDVTQDTAGDFRYGL